MTSPKAMNVRCRTRHRWKDGQCSNLRFAPALNEPLRNNNPTTTQDKDCRCCDAPASMVGSCNKFCMSICLPVTEQIVYVSKYILMCQRVGVNIVATQSRVMKFQVCWSLSDGPKTSICFIWCLSKEGLNCLPHAYSIAFHVDLLQVFNLLCNRS